MEWLARCKRSSLIGLFIGDKENFKDIDSMSQCFKNSLFFVTESPEIYARVLDPVESFQLSLIFVSKAIPTLGVNLTMFFHSVRLAG